jgi:alpha-amylase
MNRTLIYLVGFGLLIYLVSCSKKQANEQKSDRKDSLQFVVQHPEWTKNATIYEVNVRQYTPEGTFKAFEKQLPHLKELGVDILWFMPINPIGVKNRKGKLGSYYSVKDYESVNPEFGSLEDFKTLVKQAHELGFHVIIDWVANHTAWDHLWTKTHPDFYTKDSLGKFIPPIGTDWADVIDLNYDNKQLWTEMTSALKFWVDSTKIDGFRCDVADWVPIEFWDQARTELNIIKPVFMLAEAERPELHLQAFDATYAWNMHHIMNKIALGEKNVSALDSFFVKETSLYPLNALRMQFVTNHDENSWNGTVKEKFGDGEKAFAVLTYTVPGIPLIYSGQEANLDKRLKFFEKDLIDWNNPKAKDYFLFYQNLNKLKKENSALWNGDKGSALTRIKTDKDLQIFAFARESIDNKVFALFNLSNKPVKVAIDTNLDFSGMKDYFSGTQFNNQMELKPWEYRVFTK